MLFIHGFLLDVIASKGALPSSNHELTCSLHELSKTQLYHTFPEMLYPRMPCFTRLGVIQVLRNAVGVGVSAFPKKALRRLRFNIIRVMRGWVRV